LTFVGASAAIWVVYRFCRVRPSLGTFIRIVIVTVIAYALSSVWHPEGLWVLLELAIVSAVIVACLFLFGELTRKDIVFAISLFQPGRRSMV